MNEYKPKIGFLGISQELYVGMVPGIPEKLEEFATTIKKTLNEVDLDFPKVAMNEMDVREILAGFNQKKYDSVLIVNLTFGPSLNLIRAMQDNHLPILLANIQPEYEVTTTWNMNDLTYNQGIHGIQDTANCLIRLGKKFMVITDDWRNPTLKNMFMIGLKLQKHIGL